LALPFTVIQISTPARPKLPATVPIVTTPPETFGNEAAPLTRRCDHSAIIM